MNVKKADIGFFAREVLKKPLYPFQEEIGNAILDSVLNNLGLTFTVMVSRQSGKNQTSAVIEAYILCAYEDGTMVKCAPTWKPQIVNSRIRLLSMLDNDFTRDRIFKSYGYIIGISQFPQQRKDLIGSRILFFSAGNNASVVGATASLLLEIDEAQDVSPIKFDRDFRPMASTTNATTVLYGTAWADDTLLAITKQHNLELEQLDGIKRHFEYTWRELSKYNDNYRKFVESEIDRLGPEHITIRTQYELQPVSGAGFLLNDLQRHMIQGHHSWAWGPEEEEDSYLICGIDVGGEEQRARPGEDRAKRDSTVISIARVIVNDLGLPVLEVIHQICWNGMEFLSQYSMICELTEIWQLRKFVVDRSGLGDMMSSMLKNKFGEEKVSSFAFTRTSKSALTYEFLALVNSGRLKIYAPDDAPSEVYCECMKQLKVAKYIIPGEGLLSMMILPCDGHDDFLISIALCCEAIKEFEAPVVEAKIVKPRRLYRDGRY